MSGYPSFGCLVVALGMFLVGMPKGVLGATLSAVTVPLLALVLPIKDVTGMVPSSF
jgi:hypothetical protein